MKLVSLPKFLKYLLSCVSMENKYVGYLILGISVLVVFIIFMFSNAMKNIIDDGCSMMHDLGYCPAYATIDQQTYLALGIAGLLTLVGLVLVFSKPEKEIIFKTRREKKAQHGKIDITELKAEEKQILALVRDAKAIFQADLIEKTGLGKAKITRIIDRLEGKGFVERKRRGMTNIVVLRD